VADRHEARREPADARERPAATLPIRLVALDIDGTLIDDDRPLQPRTIAAVAAARDRGVHVSLVTGRMTTSAMRFARELGLVDPIVAYQGALVRAILPPERDPRLGRILAHRPLAAGTAREALAWAKRHGLECHVNHLERFVVQADDPRAEDYSAFFGARALVVPDLAAWLQRPVSKLLAVAREPIPEPVLEDARTRFSGRSAVTLSHPRFLEFLAPGVSKALGVRHLARRARVPVSSVLAIGDQFNDIEMLAAAGFSAAMPPAPDPVRAAARWIAPPIEEDGPAQLIERLVLASPADIERAVAELDAEAAAAHPPVGAAAVPAA